MPFAIGAVVEPVWGRQTPLSGQLSPVRAVVPRGFLMAMYGKARQDRRSVRIDQYDLVVQIEPYDFVGDQFMSASTFGVRLRGFRMKKKLSLQQLADQIGASKGHVWDLEQGNTKNPSLDMLTALSRALDVPIRDLVGEGEEAVAGDDVKLAPLFRDLRGLRDDQLDLIRTMTEKLRGMSDERSKTGGGSK